MSKVIRTSKAKEPSFTLSGKTMKENAPVPCIEGKMRDWEIWLNGFTSASFLGGLIRLGFGLWSHDSNTLVSAALIMFFSAVIWSATWE
jgi:hypothetical protein